MNHKSIAGAIAAALTLVCSASHAAITSTSGAAQKIAAPADVTTGKLESDTIIHAFEERSSVTTSQSVSLDITQPGTVPGPSGNNLSPGSIPQGTRINSYYIHYDKVGGSDTIKSATGSVTFGEDVIGLIITLGGLTATNGTLGAQSTIYPTGSSQHVEFNDCSKITLAPDRRTVSVTLCVTCCADNIRVITGNVSGGSVLPPAGNSGGGLGGLATPNLCGSCGTGLGTMMPVMLAACLLAKKQRRW